MSVLATHPQVSDRNTIVASHAAATTARRTGGRRMWAFGAVAGVVSSLVVIALVALAEGAGVPMEVAENSTKQPEHIPLLGYGTVILGSTLVGLAAGDCVRPLGPTAPARLRHHHTGAHGRVVRLPSDDHGNDRHQGDARDHPRHLSRALIIAAVAAHLPLRKVRDATAA